MITWRKSSFSGGNGCVETGIVSSYCSSGTCVEVVSSYCSDGTCVAVSACSSGSCIEVEHGAGFVLVRDTKDRTKEPIAVAVSSWESTILAPIMLGRLPSPVVQVAGGVEWTGHTTAGHEHFHSFTDEEWTAFELGVRDRQFELERLAQ